MMYGGGYPGGIVVGIELLELLRLPLLPWLMLRERALELPDRLIWPPDALSMLPLLDAAASAAAITAGSWLNLQWSPLRHVPLVKNAQGLPIERIDGEGAFERL
jgi:hypothetical protein